MWFKKRRSWSVHRRSKNHPPLFRKTRISLAKYNHPHPDPIQQGFPPYDQPHRHRNFLCPRNNPNRRTLCWGWISSVVCHQLLLGALPLFRLPHLPQQLRPVQILSNQFSLCTLLPLGRNLIPSMNAKALSVACNHLRLNLLR